ncbi:probable CCR4-associated factor 1 homolog 11 [Triticum aestivum]|uniref:probable CCR4-associated factor 1 homolog 11 n=1 Tax=Triticum aestivum TaxID=4565 RepID=UPI0003D42D0E|nr:probable CCR4-associated factor 1 homolog 11 [Triticum aestivum]
MCFIPNSPRAMTLDVVGGKESAPVMIGSLATPFAFLPEVSTTIPALVANGRWMLPALMSLPGNVVVRPVWAHNLQDEVELIESLLPRFRYAAVDTEFPGTVYRPKVPAYALTEEKKYALLKANVDGLHLIQLGLTLFDAAGRLPDLGTGGAVQYVWEFNFREFDVRRHRYAPESIELLRVKGVDFDRTRREGIDGAALGPRLRKLLRGGLGDAGVITFSGTYDLAYLVKLMLGRGYKLPVTPAQFESVVKAMVRKRLYDVKEMARRCPGDVDLRGGLDRVAGKLDVRRAVGEAHQAGSDSLLTCQAFMKIRERYFVDDHELTTLAGVVAGVTVC